MDYTHARAAMFGRTGNVATGEAGKWTGDMQAKRPHGRRRWSGERTAAASQPCTGRAGARQRSHALACMRASGLMAGVTWPRAGGVQTGKLHALEDCTGGGRSKRWERQLCRRRAREKKG